MHIQTLCLGAYGTNCYLVWGQESPSCVVIDPGYEPETVLLETEKRGLSIQAILLTHGHFDHVGAVEELVKRTGCRLWMPYGDWAWPESPMIKRLYPLANTQEIVPEFPKDGEQIPLAGLRFSVLETPGHTRGSVCYLCGDALFSGDTLFAGSCGRTDLPGGNHSQILRSLARLKQLSPNTRVFPGHGESSVLCRELTENPYLC